MNDANCSAIAAAALALASASGQPPVSARGILTKRAVNIPSNQAALLRQESAWLGNIGKPGLTFKCLPDQVLKQLQNRAENVPRGGDASEQVLLTTEPAAPTGEPTSQKTQAAGTKAGEAVQTTPDDAAVLPPTRETPQPSVELADSTDSGPTQTTPGPQTAIILPAAAPEAARSEQPPAPLSQTTTFVTEAETTSTVAPASGPTIAPLSPCTPGPTQDSTPQSVPASLTISSHLHDGEVPPNVTGSEANQQAPESEHSPLPESTSAVLLDSQQVVYSSDWANEPSDDDDDDDAAEQEQAASSPPLREQASLRPRNHTPPRPTTCPQSPDLSSGGFPELLIEIPGALEELSGREIGEKALEARFMTTARRELSAFEDRSQSSMPSVEVASLQRPCSAGSLATSVGSDTGEEQLDGAMHPSEAQLRQQRKRIMKAPVFPDLSNPNNRWLSRQRDKQRRTESINGTGRGSSPSIPSIITKEMQFGTREASVSPIFASGANKQSAELGISRQRSTTPIGVVTTGKEMVSKDVLHPTERPAPSQAPAIAVDITGNVGIPPKPTQSASQDQAAQPTQPASQPAGTWLLPYDAFTATYPDYKGDLEDFLRACYCLQGITKAGSLASFLFDDVVRSYLNFADYVQTEGTGTPLNLLQWYFRHADAHHYAKHVVSRDNVEAILQAYPDRVRSIVQIAQQLGDEAGKAETGREAEVDPTPASIKEPRQVSRPSQPSELGQPSQPSQANKPDKSSQPSQQQSNQPHSFPPGRRLSGDLTDSQDEDSIQSNSLLHLSLLGGSGQTENSLWPHAQPSSPAAQFLLEGDPNGMSQSQGLTQEPVHGDDTTELANSAGIAFSPSLVPMSPVRLPSSPIKTGDLPPGVDKVQYMLRSPAVGQQESQASPSLSAAMTAVPPSPPQREKLVQKPASPDAAQLWPPNQDAIAETPVKVKSGSRKRGREEISTVIAAPTGSQEMPQHVPSSDDDDDDDDCFEPLPGGVRSAKGAERTVGRTVTTDAQPSVALPANNNRSAARPVRAPEARAATTTITDVRTTATATVTASTTDKPPEKKLKQEGKAGKSRRSFSSRELADFMQKKAQELGVRKRSWAAVSGTGR